MIFRLVATAACLVSLVAVVVVQTATAFTTAPLAATRTLSSFSGPLLSASTGEAAATDLLGLSLSKPLGIILEEVQEGQAAGVFVLDFAESGSALEYAEQIKGATLATVGGENVQALDFDAVMEKIINAPETVDLEFVVQGDAALPSFDVGTPVAIQIGDQTIEAKVGDNLRKVLQENGVEVYQGMKQKLGNCGGAGQCTFCAMDFLESEGWSERSDYEDQKLAKFPQARLACLNSIQGPATIQKTQR